MGSNGLGVKKAKSCKLSLRKAEFYGQFLIHLKTHFNGHLFQTYLLGP